MNSPPRVAFFTDSFHEVNGVAHTSRHLEAFTRRRGLPFLSVHEGSRQDRGETPVRTLELSRSRAAFALDRDLFCDPLLLRYREQVTSVLAEFRPDVIHVTGPGDFGLLGACLAHSLRIPLVASWHTNLHEFAAQRLGRLLEAWPDAIRDLLTGQTEIAVLACAMTFYRLARVALAPNPELVELLSNRTGRPTFLMQRGIDTDLFSPTRRESLGQPLTLGFVGRLTPEKNVRFLVEMERALSDAGRRNFRFLVVGDGSEKPWLAGRMSHAEFTGVLSGESLARAYANMDIFLFPSHTDTFGNVVLEAMASGVPAIVTADGGPKFLVAHGETGFVSRNDQQFIRFGLELTASPDLRKKMQFAARFRALEHSWDRVFETVYSAYEACLRSVAGNSRPSLSHSIAIPAG